MLIPDTWESRHWGGQEENHSRREPSKGIVHGPGSGCSTSPVKRAMREKSLSRVKTHALCSCAIAAISASMVVRLTPLVRPSRKIAAASRYVLKINPHRGIH